MLHLLSVCCKAHEKGFQRQPFVNVPVQTLLYPSNPFKRVEQFLAPHRVRHLFQNGQGFQPRVRPDSLPHMRIIGKFGLSRFPPDDLISEACGDPLEHLFRSPFRFGNRLRRFHESVHPTPSLG